MITFLIKLTKLFKFFDAFIKRFILVYNAQLPVLIDDKKSVRLRCENNLRLINEYEKLGPSCGLPSPKIYKQPKEGV